MAWKSVTVSEHPLAQAIVDSTIEQGIDPETVTDFHAIAGHGVQATYNGHQLLFGNKKLMLTKGVVLMDFVNKAQKFADEAKHTDLNVFMAHTYK